MNKDEDNLKRVLGPGPSDTKSGEWDSATIRKMRMMFLVIPARVAKIKRIFGL